MAANSSRKPIVAGNWKMNKTVAEAIDLANDIKRDLAGCKEVDIVLCPPFTALKAVSDAVTGTHVDLGAQHMHWEKSGAYTGEVSAEMLREVYCHYVILGHSERRTYFGETDEALARKLVTAIGAGLQPILCVGETERERRSNETEAVLSRQVLTDLAELHDDDLGGVVIAYEPIWAIGTGLTASVEQAVEAAATIRDLVRTRSEQAADRVRILYGGSVKPDNAAELLAPEEIDGALVGGASLSVDDFQAILAAAPSS